MITIPLTQGQFSWVFNPLVCSGVGDVWRQSFTLSRHYSTSICILLESNQDSKKIPSRPELVDNSCQYCTNVGLLRPTENCDIFPGDFLRLKAHPTVALLGDVKVLLVIPKLR